MHPSTVKLGRDPRTPRPVHRRSSCASCPGLFPLRCTPHRRRRRRHRQLALHFLPSELSGRQRHRSCRGGRRLPRSSKCRRTVPSRSARCCPTLHRRSARSGGRRRWSPPGGRAADRMRTTPARSEHRWPRTPGSCSTAPAFCSRSLTRNHDSRDPVRIRSVVTRSVARLSIRANWGSAAEWSFRPRHT